jgi:hypothetical protein
VAKATRRSSCGRVEAWNSVPGVAVMAGFDSSVGPRMDGCRPEQHWGRLGAYRI